MKLLTKGTRIYNHGDMANVPHSGTITEVKADRWGTQYEITPDPDPERETAKHPYWIPVAMISPEFKGHSGTRIVTEAALEHWRTERLRELQTETPIEEA